jgi:DNA repair protein RadA/Sms
MKILGHSSFNKNFTRASDIVIPDIYNRRFKTGKEGLDFLFGGSGFLPGQVITLAAGAGTGKSSFLLQVMELLEKSGKKTAYISGEETVEQISFDCKRLNVTRVPLANITDIEDIEEAIKNNKFDFIVLDSFPSITTKKDLNAKQKEEYIVNQLVKIAKTYEVCLALVLHMTKAGTFKGNTLITHAVDTFITIDKNPDNSQIRDFFVHKNRFGGTSFNAFYFKENGYDFETKAEVSESSPKKSNKKSKSKIILEILNEPKTLAQISQEADVSGSYLNSILRQLIQEEKVQKKGKKKQTLYFIKDKKIL